MQIGSVEASVTLARERLDKRLQRVEGLACHTAFEADM